ncbi:gamma-glutamyltransferase [Muricoccus radiodurans]|uniref:gamma-glutamyltransferase n=1 Tax=Muricoccus radiodurans TaxID=2231721 RepID=UPI003CE96241
MPGMIVAPQPEAVEAGAQVLERGGNAVDAAIVCGLVQGVVDPLMVGIGGFGTMQVYMPQRGVHQVLEFFARAPLAATPDMWESKLLGQSRDGFAFLLEGGISEAGHLAVCTPGNVMGYAEALRRWGTMDWKDAFGPAIGYARNGFMVRPHVHWFMTQDQSGTGQVNTSDKLRLTESGRRLFFRGDGNPKRPGDIVQNTDLARTLERLAAGGPDLFYTGEMAEEIAADFQAHGALISREDLRNYKISLADPLWGEYRGHRVATLPPPSSGFAMMQLLHILDHFDIGSLRHGSVEHVRILAEAMKRMTIDKDRNMGDPAFVKVPTDELLSRDYTAAAAEGIRRGERLRVTRLEKKQDKDTTHVSVVDKDGNCVTMTHTLGSPSGAITEGLGIMWNGTMSRFDPRPGRPGSIAPGKRRSASQAPTIVFRGDRPRIVIGAPGGTYIAPAIAQGISNVIDFGMSMSDAVAAPRVVAVSDSIDVSNRVRRDVTDELAAMGYDIKRSPMSYAFAALHGIAVEGDRLQGGADPQRDGMAILV